MVEDLSQISARIVWLTIVHVLFVLYVEDILLEGVNRRERARDWRLPQLAPKRCFIVYSVETKIMSLFLSFVGRVR